MKVKRFIAILLAVVLVLGLIPLTSVGGGVAYAAPSYPRATAIDASKITFNNSDVKVISAQLIPGTPTTEEVPDMGTYYNNSGTINIYVDAIPDDVTELTWSRDSIAAALSVNWGIYAGESYTQDFTENGITVSANDSWKAKNHECFFAYDNETFLGPTCLYDVTIILMPPQATEIDATKIDLGGSITVTGAQLIPGTPTTEEVPDMGTYYNNSGTINIYVDAIPDDVTELTWSRDSIAAALSVNWGIYAGESYTQDFTENGITVSANDSWKAKNHECFFAYDNETFLGPTCLYDVAIYEGACPPQATAIDASKINLGAGITVVYAQLIPGTPTTEEVPDMGTYYNNSGTINIYVDAIPDDVTELTWSRDSIAAALSVNWGIYAGESYTQDFTENGITVSANDSWKAKNHECFFAYDNETFLGPTCLYDVAIYEGGVREEGVVLSNGSVSRTSDTSAEITFTASEAGSYVWAWADTGTIPAKPTDMEAVTMAAGTNTLTVTNLTAGAKKLCIWAADASGSSAADVFSVDILAYTSAGWPQLSSFIFTDGKWSVSSYSKQIELTNENITISNYESLIPYSEGETTKFYAGDVIIHCPENTVITSGATLINWSASAAVSAGFSNVAVSTDGSIALNLTYGTADSHPVISAEKDGTKYSYYYTVKVVCDGLLYSVPNTWTLNEAGDTFTFKPGKYLSSYAKWNTTNQVVPTWGTTLNKTFLNFTAGSDTFTLTNSVGATKTYTVNLEMPWQLSVPAIPGYNVSFIKSGDTQIQAAVDLEKAGSAFFIKKEIEVGSVVTMAIKPYGDNAGRVIDTITLTNADEENPITYSDSDIPITINGNTFFFTMPRKDVKVASVTFKEDTSPRYTISTTTSKFRSDIGSAMGTVKVTDVNGVETGDAHAGNDITVTAAPVEHDAYTFQFDRWEAEGITLNEAQKATATISFEMPAGNVSLNAVFKKVGAELTFSADSESALASVALYGTSLGPMSTDFNTTRRDIVKPGATIKVWPIGNDQFVLESYTIKDQDNTDIQYTSEGTWCEFTVPENATSVHVTANYRAKAFSEITTAVNDKTMGSVTATVNGTSISAAVTEGETVTLTATPKFRYKFDSWTVTYADGSVIDFDLTYAEGTPNIATFKVPANGKEINITANFVRDETQNSAECEMRRADLYDGETNVGRLSKSGTNYTITLPADTDTSKLDEMILKLTASEHATITKSGDTEAKDWASGQPCGMTLDTPATFVVTAEDGTTTKTYTITIKQEAAPKAPTLSDGSATRTSKTSATVTFTSSEAGMYFYSVVNDNAAAPTIATTGRGTAASAGSNTITLTNLTEDARDIYIVVKNANDATSDALKVDIPAYGDSTVPDTGAYSITYSGPKGGKLVPSRTKADKGDTITVTAVPDSGYQMVAGSMTYTLAVSGGTTTKITGNQFTMPEGDVTLSCQWKTATATTTSGITAFTINGVAAAVNNTTNVITITLPRGTDVTKLTPVISTSGVKSLSPASGKTVDFTNSVTYTATMDDGSTKTYTVTVYVDKGSLADQFWDKLTDFYNQTPWWQYAEHQQSTKKYPKYW